MANCRRCGGGRAQGVETRQTQSLQAAEEMPMHHYIHPIPLYAREEGGGLEKEEILEILDAQNQVLLRILDRLEQVLDRLGT